MDNRPKNKGLQIAGEHGAATTESRYGKEFLLQKIREKEGYAPDVYGALDIYDQDASEPEPPQVVQAAIPLMVDILGPDGVIARTLSGYESRKPQLQMAQIVADCIEGAEHCIVEAGTGTGKSLAYLIPAIYSSKKTIVSTGDKGLQDQLWRKDVPFLQAVLPIQFKAAILKGKNNYVCLEEFDREAGFQALDDESQEFSDVRAWLGQTESGDLEELAFGLTPELRGKLTTTADACTGRHCSYYGDCWAERAKTKADLADIVIVNHSLLALDAAIRQKSDGYARIISDRDLVIIDECHRLEDAATLAFTDEVSLIGVLRLLRDRHVQDAQIDSAQTERIQEQAQGFFEALADLSERQTYIVDEPPERITTQAENLARALSALAADLKRHCPYAGSGKTEAFAKFVARVEVYADTIFSILQRSETHVVYVEKKQGRRQVLIYLKRCPISVADDLKEALFGHWPVICTSATVATGTGFDYFKSRVGCPDTTELIVGSPFNYKRNALIYMPADGQLFDPTRYYQDGSPEYFDRLADQIEQLLLASDGRAFCLFTSNRALNEVYGRLAFRLRWLALRQGEMPRPELVRRFKEDGRAVLFGLKSFWEGVDVQGEALSLVIIDKIPFGQPDDPVYDARCQEIVKRTGDKWAWFSKLALPNAIISYKQGFGRLIRTKQDRGVVALLDGRLTVKNYGTTVIRSLPPATTTRSLEAVETFFASAS